MTEAEAVAKMKAIADGTFYADQKYADGTPRVYDAETQHGDADVLLCDFLNGQGHGALVSAFQGVPKWYA